MRKTVVIAIFLLAFVGGCATTSSREWTPEEQAAAEELARTLGEIVGTAAGGGFRKPR